jgi:hypothetical protein
MQRLSVLYFKSPSLVCILHGHGGRGIDDDPLVKLSGPKIECLRSWVWFPLSGMVKSIDNGHKVWWTSLADRKMQLQMMLRGDFVINLFVCWCIMGEANHNPVGWGTTIVFLDDDAINDDKPYGSHSSIRMQFFCRVLCCIPFLQTLVMMDVCFPAQIIYTWW